MSYLARTTPLWSLLLLFTSSCSEDQLPPPTSDLPNSTQDGAAEGALVDKGFPFDGFDPTCPMGPPCILSKGGEGKHAEEMLVIGEVLTITGTDLQDVDTVYVGAAVAPLISVTPTEVRCRIGPRTPPGLNGLEVKSGSKRRKVSGVMIRRLLALLADDSATVSTFDTTTHTGGPELQLPSPPVHPPQISHTGRYLIARGETQLMIADLAREEVALVEGLEGKSVTSVTTTREDQALLISVESGGVLRADLTTFPSLTAQPQTDLPTTLALAGDASSTFVVGIHDDAATGESSLWFAADGLPPSQWALTGGQPLLLGSGSGISSALIEARGKLWAGLATGATPYLAILNEDSGQLAGVGAFPVAESSGMALAAGEGFVALERTSAPPSLYALPVRGSEHTPATIALGTGTAPARTRPRRIPSHTGLIGVLVGPAESQPFIAGTLELVDLEQMTRLTAPGGGSALDLTGMRDVQADPLDNILHMFTESELRSYSFVIQDTTVTLTERQPHMFLTGGRSYRWLAVQP